MISVVIPHYNASNLLAETVNSVLLSSTNERVPVEIVISDDGSDGDHLASALALVGPDTKVVSSGKNMGRSGAVNFGVSAASHDLVLILDCDCHPGSNMFFRSHLQAIAGADASLGGLLKLENNFWGRYQDRAVKRRIRHLHAGMPYSFTTQNILVRKGVFLSVGGYDESYRHYGFEDRDLLIRLHEAGTRFAHSPDSAALHCDTRISLPSLVRKMREAGRHTSDLFRSRHPVAYRELGYSAIDATLHPSLKLLRPISGRFTDWVANRVESWLGQVPFPLGSTLAKIVIALAYIDGTINEAVARHISARTG